jgi:hypothetical protein
MRDSIPAPKGLWLKTRFANLVRYVPSGIYFSRIRVRGKLIRRSLKTNKLAVAKLRLADLEQVERQRIERQGAIVNGNMTFAGGVAYRTLPVQNPSRFQMVRARGLEPPSAGVSLLPSMSISLSFITHHYTTIPLLNQHILWIYG